MSIIDTETGEVIEALSVTKCSKCGVDKPATLDFFAPRPQKRNGLASWCRECSQEKERGRIRHRKPAESRLLRDELMAKGLGVCSRCKQIKPLNDEYFWKDSRKVTGFSSWCKPCNRDSAKTHQDARRTDPTQAAKLYEEKQKYSQSPKGKERKRIQSQTANHKRRQRHLETTWDWTPEDWERCKSDWNNRCAYCGTGGKLTQDHFVPLSDKHCPGTIRTNIVPACQSCNSSKQSRSPYEWCKSETLDRIHDYFSLLIDDKYITESGATKIDLAQKDAA